MGSNSPDREQKRNELDKRATKYGEDAARGRDALPNLALDMLEMAAQNVVNEDKDQDGNDDAKRYYGLYIKGDSRKSVHDHTPQGKAANESKLRQIIRLGQNPKFDGVAVLHAAMATRKDALKKEQKVLPVYKAQVEIARNANKQDIPPIIAQVLEWIMFK